jgi:WD40 repeat protein
VNAVSVDPAGRRVATGSDDQTVRVWDVRTGEALLLLREHRAAVRGVCFDPSGRRLVSGSSDGTLRIWESDLDAARRVWRHRSTSASARR